MDLAKVFLEAQDNSGPAWQSFRNNAESSIAPINKVSAAVAGVSAAVGAFSLSKMVVDTVKARAQLDDLAESSGLTVEKLSQLKAVAAVSGGGFEDLVQSVSKFNKAIVEAAEDGGSAAAKSFRKLGIDLKDASGQLKSTDQLLDQTAKTLGTYANSTTKSAMATEFFGKAGTKNLPVLNDYAEAIGVAVTVTAKQAAEAERLEKQWNLLGLMATTTKQRIGGELMPAVSALTDVLVDMRKESANSGDFLQKLTGVKFSEWAAGAAVGVGLLVDSLQFIASVGSTIPAMALGIVNGLQAIGQGLAVGGLFATGQFDAAGRQLELLKTNLANTGGFLKEAFANVGKSFNTDVADRVAAAYVASLKRIQDSVGDTKKTLTVGADMTKFFDELDKLLGKINGKDQGIDAGFYKDLETLYTGFRVGKLSVEEYRKAVEKMIQQQPFVKDGLKLEEDARKDLIKAMEEEQKARDALSKVESDYATAVEDAIAQAEFEITLIGKSAKEIALLTEARKIDLEMRKQIAGLKLRDDATEDEVRQYAAAIDRIRALAERAKENIPRLVGDKAELEQADKDYKDFYSRAVQYGADAFGAIFTKSSNGLRGFIDQSWASLKSFFARLAAEKIIVPVILESLGMTGGSGGTGGLGGGGGGLGGLGSIFSLFGGSTGAFGNGMTFGGSAGFASVFETLGQGSMAFDAGSLLGAANPYIAAALAAYSLYQQFADKGENPKYRLGFGNQAQAYASNGVFGRQGFVYAEGNDAANQATRQYQQSFDGLDTQISRLLSSGQIASITNRLNGTQGREFSFPKGDPTASEQLSLEYLKIKYSAVFAEINSKFADTIASFDGKSDELIKKIGEMLTAYEAVGKAIENITATIDAMNGDALTNFQRQLDQLTENVDSAAAVFNAAVEGGDLKAIADAEKTLTGAVIARYNTEMELLSQLTGRLKELETTRWEFRAGINQRLLDAGDTSRPAQSAFYAERYRTLAGQNFAGMNPADRLTAVNSTLGALDQWRTAEIARIQSTAQARVDAENTITRAQQTAAKTRLGVLQDELEALQKQASLTDDWKSVVTSVAGQIKQMQLSGANPLSAFGRYDVASDDLQSLLARFRNATGADKIALASQIQNAASSQLSLLDQTRQRPSDGYLAGYNQIVAALSEVQGGAQSEVQLGLQLQTQIEAHQARISELTDQINQYSETIANNTADTTELIAQVNQAYIDRTLALEQVGLQAIDEDREATQELLNALTGGSDPELFAVTQRERTIALLEQIRTDLQNAAANQQPIEVNVDITIPSGGGGGGPGGGGGGGGTLDADTARSIAEFIGQEVGQQISLRITQIRREALQA